MYDPIRRVLIGLVVGIASLLGLSAPASAHNGLPDDLSAYRWTGTLTTSWDYTTKQGQSTTTIMGSLGFSDLERTSTSTQTQAYVSEIHGSGSFESSNEGCGVNQRRDLDYNGPTPLFAGSHAQTTFEVASTPEGFEFRPYRVYLPTRFTDYHCKNYGGGVSNEGTDEYSWGGFLHGDPNPFVVLREDLDSDPYHLVGATKWTKADPPTDIWEETDPYSFSVTYDLRLVPAEPACSDGVDNDGDGTADANGAASLAGDPGCESETDASEHGSAECDNGIDDDLNGRIDYRKSGGDPGCVSLTDQDEGDDHCDGGDVGFSSRLYRGSVTGFGSLFTFAPSARYRFTETCAEIIQASGGGYTAFDNATLVKTSALELLGFKTRWDEANYRDGLEMGTEPEILGGHDAADPPRAVVKGDFDVHFDWLVLASKFKVAKKLRKSKSFKALAKDVQRRVDRAYKNVDFLSREQRKKVIRKWVAPFQVFVSNELQDIFERRLRFLPNRWQRGITEGVMKLVTKHLLRLNKLVAQSGEAGQRKTIGRAIVNGFLKRLMNGFADRIPNDFSVWSPDVTITVRPGGDVTYDRSGFKNPFVSVKHEPGTTQP